MTAEDVVARALALLPNEVADPWVRRRVDWTLRLRLPVNADAAAITLVEQDLDKAARALIVKVLAMVPKA